MKRSAEICAENVVKRMKSFREDVSGMRNKDYAAGYLEGCIKSERLMFDAIKEEFESRECEQRAEIMKAIEEDWKARRAINIDKCLQESPYIAQHVVNMRYS